MSRRHFKALAGIIAAYQKANPDPGAQKLLLALAHNLADLCSQENPRFDRARFIAACGFED